MNDQNPMKEPSVLDYLKSILTPWKGKPPVLPEPERLPPSNVVEAVERESVGAASEIEMTVAGTSRVPPEAQIQKQSSAPLGWRTLLAFVLAVIGQWFMEPPEQRITMALIFYGLSAAMLVFALISREWLLPDLEEAERPEFPTSVSRNPLLLSIPLLLAAFIFFGGNRFNVANLILWGLGTGLFIAAFYIPASQSKAFLAEARNFFRRRVYSLQITPWTVLMVAALALVIFFRFYRLDQVPGEMFSDHAEKLTDVSELLQGQFSVFFPRNTGREAFQMYLTAFVAIFAGTQISFLSLKIGTALAGFFTLPFIYLLGKEIGGRWVGFFAFVLAGVAYWGNVISRIGLRFPIYPLFVAPALYFLIRGIRHRQRNDFIWAGIALGIGLHGYSPARLVPLVVIVAVMLYLLHRQSGGNRKETVAALLLLSFTSLVVFLPLLRYLIGEPEMFMSRALSRLGETETVYPSPVGLIFLENLWRSLVMFFYNNGNIWVHSIPNRPALDILTAALYFIGSGLVFLRYLRRRHWLDLFLLVSIPLLMLPSILSLAFPEENPSLNRSGGAIIPVFILAAIGLDAVKTAIQRRFPGNRGSLAAIGVTFAILAMSISANFDLVFRQFDRQFMAGAWNTSQIGAVIRAFADSQGNPDTAYVVPYPHWVDTRLVAINAGYPMKDYALWPDQFEATLAEPRAQMFVVNPRDVEATRKLQELYPHGSLYYYDVDLDGKDFLLFFTPPATEITIEPVLP
ncbi:MAG: glycosyltransferase family 39 protein [Chloroflexota bacterium]|jgi:hypothetical protein